MAIAMAAPGGDVVERLNKVMTAVQSVGKGDRNTQQGYSFRGIDAVVNAVGPALREHGVVVVPLVEEVTYNLVEVGKNRTPMRECTVKVRYRFHGPVDSIECVSIGEAMDSGDKATPKAMSVAFRVALLQALCIPTDEPDADAEAYERAPTYEWDPIEQEERVAEYARVIVAVQSNAELTEQWKAIARDGNTKRLSPASVDHLIQVCAARKAELNGAPA